ncbi:MAG: methylthioribulose 1-phosphate dehydratase [Gammaproteobacteria bacterium]|jgi:methylthioribulose-1-phosphate dehydratase
MNDSRDAVQLAQTLIDVGREFHMRGWVPATAGNFSVRLDEERCLITVSGRHKGRLNADDFMEMRLDGEPLSPGKRASAETGLHLALYRSDAQTGCVLHTHSVASTVLSRISMESSVELSDMEVLKAFPGIDTHETSLKLPVFPNDQDIPRLAHTVDDWFEKNPPVPGYLIKGHGLYAWGADVNEAMTHAEALEFLLDCELRLRQVD